MHWTMHIEFAQNSLCLAIINHAELRHRYKALDAGILFLHGILKYKSTNAGVWVVYSHRNNQNKNKHSFPITDGSIKLLSLYIWYINECPADENICIYTCIVFTVEVP